MWNFFTPFSNTFHFQFSFLVKTPPMCGQKKPEVYERYDRQIRVWGETSQHQISSTNVYIDYLSDLSSEVIKNLVLLGIGKVIIGLVPDRHHTLLPINTNNVFHILKGMNQLDRIRGLNPHVSVIVSSDLDELKNSGPHSSHFIFVYHSLSGAQEHQKVLRRMTQLSKNIHCFCINALGDIGRILYFDLADTQKTSITDHVSNQCISHNAGPLESEFFIVWNIVSHLVELDLAKLKTLFHRKSCSKPVSLVLPSFHAVVEMILLSLNQSFTSITDMRVPFLADCILSAYKVTTLQKLYEGQATNISVHFTEPEKSEKDNCVSLGVELCSIIGGIASQEIIKLIRGSTEIQSDPKTHVCQCIFVDAWDRCESEVKMLLRADNR